MAQHAILRFEKHKGNPARPLEAHYKRQKEQYASNSDIDTNRSKYNFHIDKSEGRYYHFIQSRIEQAGCRTRKATHTWLAGANNVLLSYVNVKIAELDGRKQELVKQTAELTVEAISPEQVEPISGYLDTWDDVSFDDKRRVVDLIITIFIFYPLFQYIQIFFQSCIYIPCLKYSVFS